MKFKYSEFEEPDGKTISRPEIPVLFKNGKKIMLTRAIIDSGADFIILPIEIEYIIRKEGFRNITHKTVVFFAESQPAILLGNHGFLQKLIVTLNGPKKEVEITID